ncbi:hypothetical protein THAOC_35111 [Thalassiosira oceanica]|uniref:Uncharacterized protein n=1 Tax=Thalassiosira oceanica TaxID=159749 RepID=K0R3X8_THAOC|nr:hypothetical protein THAOC_35111 [Thalassiosira oceanica]|eukprot:EJK46234.1 hypothetical protein THAOC_35111 [Thalassiosira oceanica]
MKKRNPKIARLNRESEQNIRPGSNATNGTHHGGGRADDDDVNNEHQSTHGRRKRDGRRPRSDPSTGPITHQSRRQTSPVRGFRPMFVCPRHCNIIRPIDDSDFFLEEMKHPPETDTAHSTQHATGISLANDDDVNNDEHQLTYVVSMPSGGAPAGPLRAGRFKFDDGEPLSLLVKLPKRPEKLILKTSWSPWPTISRPINPSFDHRDVRPAPEERLEPCLTCLRLSRVLSCRVSGCSLTACLANTHQSRVIPCVDQKLMSDLQPEDRHGLYPSNRDYVGWAKGNVNDTGLESMTFGSGIRCWFGEINIDFDRIIRQLARKAAAGDHGLRILPLVNNDRKGGAFPIMLHQFKRAIGRSRNRVRERTTQAKQATLRQGHPRGGRGRLQRQSQQQ